MKKILIVIGTRPEAIKIAPLVLEFINKKKFNTKLCVTGQHRQMLDQVLNFFSIEPQYDLDLMQHNRSLASTFSTMLESLQTVFNDFKPDIVLVHGDTITTSAASLAAYFNKIFLGHIEAGLRTQDLYAPWPEEGNRRIAGVLAQIHFAPTNTAKQNLLNENIPESNIHVTGNTVIDALHIAKNKLIANKTLEQSLMQKYKFISEEKKLILMTGHRRENFGDGFKNICEALKKIAQRNKDVLLIYPLHLNPSVKGPVEKLLSGQNNIFLVEPLEYIEFVYLMSRSYLVLTDSGGIQEEAPSFGKPVLVLREKTERPEAVKSGTVKLVGTDVEEILKNTENLLNNPKKYEEMSFSHNPYGDGKASKRIANILERHCEV